MLFLTICLARIPSSGFEGRGRSWTCGRSWAREAVPSVVLSRYSTLENTTMQRRTRYAEEHSKVCTKL